MTDTKPATKPQLIALRDALLALIDLLGNSRNREDEERDADWQAQVTELRGGGRTI